MVNTNRELGKERREKIASRLRLMRAEQGLTQKQLAKKLGLSHPTIISWERDDGENKVPSLEHLIKMADLYDVDVGYLLCEYDSEFYEDGIRERQLKLTPGAVSVIEPNWYSVPFKKENEEIAPLEEWEEVPIIDYTLSYLIENSEEIIEGMNALKHFQYDFSSLKADPEHIKYKRILESVDDYFEFYNPDAQLHEGHDTRRDVFIKEMRKVIKKDGEGKNPCSLIKWKEYGRLYDLLKGYERNAIMYSLNQCFNNMIEGFVADSSNTKKGR